MDIKPQQCIKCLVKGRLELSPAAEGQLFCHLALAFQLFDSPVSITFQHRSNAYLFRQHVNNTSLWKKLWHQKPLIFVDHYLIICQNKTGRRVTSASPLLPRVTILAVTNWKIKSSDNKVILTKGRLEKGVWLCYCHCPSVYTSEVLWSVMCMSWTLPVRRDECKVQREHRNKQANWLSCFLVLPCYSYSSAKRWLYCSKLSLC